MSVCQGCENYYEVDVLVPDDIWQRIKPEGKPEGAGLLCGVCIFRRLDDLDEFAAFRLLPM